MSTTWTPNYGQLDTPAPSWAAQKPIRIALLGDFRGTAAGGRLDIGRTLGSHKAHHVEFDSLEDMLSRLEVSVSLQVGEDLHTRLAITELESFHPDELYRNVDVFTELAGLRKQLNNPATYAKAAAKIQSWSGKVKRKASQAARRQRSRGASPAADAKLSDFSRLVGATHAAHNPSDVDAWVQRIVAPFVVSADSPDKAKLQSTLDAALSDAMRMVLHHPDFQTMESLWRGVDWLLRQLETGPSLQVHLIDVSADELAADLSSVEDLSESGLYQLLVNRPGQDKTGGYTFVAGLYTFEATPPHTELLGRMAQIAQHAGATFITELNVDDLTERKKPPHHLVQEALKALQTMPAASHLALFGPRFMLRHPYGKKTDPISSFEFEEFNAQSGLSGLLWAHPALAALAVLAGTGGQSLGDLPFHHYKDHDGDTIALPCTDRLVKQDQASTLQGWGVNALMAHKGAPEVNMSWLNTVNGEALGKTKTTSNQSRAGIQTKVEIGSKVSVSARAPLAGTKAATASTANDSDDISLDDDLSHTDDDSSDDLDALLASLGGDDDASDSPTSDDTDTSSDDEMDPELAALLASLE